MSVSAAAAVLDPRELRQALGTFVTGVTIVVLDDAEQARALTVNSFTSVSLDPPLVLVCLGKETKAGAAVAETSQFSINVLAERQRDLSLYFAGRWGGDEPPAFRFHSAPGTAARLEGAALSLSCRTHAIHDGGDHWILVGLIAAVIRPAEELRPLVFHRGRYVSVT
jgi:flavin reductase (DIM6/NTAB) family NADH-FMN oxidoreductase RutF